MRGVSKTPRLAQKEERIDADGDGNNVFTFDSDQEPEVNRLIWKYEPKSGNEPEYCTRGAQDGSPEIRRSDKAHDHCENPRTNSAVKQERA